MEKKLVGSPTLGFICPTCQHGMRSVCDACEHKAAEEASEEAGRDAEFESYARAGADAVLRAIPGYQALEVFFEGAFGVEIDVDRDEDEDGPTGIHTATLRGVPWLVVDGGQGSTSEAAVKALRANLVEALRAAADELTEDSNVQP
jgi:hypothetical protein